MDLRSFSNAIADCCSIDKKKFHSDMLNENLIEKAIETVRIRCYDGSGLFAYQSFFEYPGKDHTNFATTLWDCILRYSRKVDPNARALENNVSGNASSFLSVESETSQAIVARSADDMVKDLNARLALTMTPEEIDEYKRNITIQRSIQRAIYQQGYIAFRDSQIVPLGQNLPAPPPRRRITPITRSSTNMV
jgi:hypothetical protein